MINIYSTAYFTTKLISLSRMAKIYHICCKDNIKILVIPGYEIDPIYIELMKQYDGILFSDYRFNGSINCIPSNIKYIDLSGARYFDKELLNLPPGLIGLALHESYPADKLIHLSYGLKIFYSSFHIYNTTNMYMRPPPANADTLINLLPQSVEFVAMRNKIHIPHMLTDNRYTKHIIPNDKSSQIIFDIDELEEKYKDILSKPLIFGF